MYGPTIAALLREGAIAGLWDGRSGHWRDLSGNGNHGTMSAGMRQTGPAGSWVLPAITDEVTVADAASLRLTTGSIVVVSERGFTSQVTNERMLSHYTGTTGFVFYFNATSLAFTYDGPAAQTIVTSVIGKRSLGVSFTTGAVPIGYADAVSLGNFSGAVTVTATAAATEIGNWNNLGRVRSPLSAVLIANRILTPTEFAAVHAELLSVRWPSSQSILAMARQGSPIGEAGLVAGFDLRPVGASIPSHDGAFTGTVSGDAHYRKSILGDALQLGRTTGAADLGVGNAQINPTTDSHWVEVWARPLDVAMVDAAAPIIGKGVSGAYSHFNNFGIEHTSANILLYWYETAPPAYPAVTGPKPLNKLTHFVYQVDHATSNAYLYVDGVQYGPTAIGADLLAAQATNWLLGKCGATAASFDEGFGGLAVCPRIGLGILTPAQVLARYALGARAVQFKTDWGYPVSPSDEGGVTGQQIGGHASPFRAGDTTGRWRVETDTVDGKTCKVLVCKTAGVVYVPAAYFGMGTTPTESAYGTWEWWIYKGADTNATYVNFVSELPIWNAAGNDGYLIAINNLERLALQYTVAGVTNNLCYTADAFVTVGAWHNFRITRSIAGSFTVYWDGSLVPVTSGTNPITNTSTTTGYYCGFDMDAGDKLALADVGGGHALMKQLGVNAP